MAKYSIIIPVFNIKNYIGKAIESVINQTINDIEIIVVNDGSTDDSLDVITSYMNLDSRIILIDKTNGGLSSARNAGLKVAKGEYIIFLDGDDWLRNDALYVIDKQIDNNDLLIFSMYYYYNENKIFENNSNINLIGECSPNDFMHTVIKNRMFNLFVAWNKVYKRSILNINNISFVEGILHEDNPFFFDICLSVSKIKIIPDCLYFYRQQRNGAITSTHTLKNIEGIIKGNEYIKRNIGNNNKYVNFLFLTLYVFQVTKYKTIQDQRGAYKYLRSYRVKMDLIYLLFHSYYRRNTYILAFLLLIDPLLLMLIIKNKFNT